MAPSRGQVESVRKADFTVVREVGSGGMARLFLARWAGFEKQVVIKVLRKELTSDELVREAFVHAAELNAQLQHDNIVQVYGIGVSDGPPFIVLEFVNGVDLATLLERVFDAEQHVPLPVVWSLFSDVAAALMYAHDAKDAAGEPLGIVHRDVTPMNVLLGRDGQAKLGDFGIAKATQKVGAPKLTRRGMAKGTLAYMAPEQILCLPLDRRVDVYQVAMVLYEMLTRYNPFLGNSDFETMDRVIESPLPPLHELRADAPARLEAVLQRGLFRDPERRFASVAELRQEVARCFRDIGGDYDDVRRFLAQQRGAAPAAEQK